MRPLHSKHALVVIDYYSTPAMPMIEVLVTARRYRRSNPLTLSLALDRHAALARTFTADFVTARRKESDAAVHSLEASIKSRYWIATLHLR